MKTIAPAILASCLAFPAVAQDTRALDAHEHGVSTLQVAVEDGSLSLDFESPGMDLVGFEYAASTAADKDAVAVAIGQLLQPDQIVTLPAAAGCRLAAASANLHGAHDHDDDDHDHDHDAAHEDHSDDDHADHDETDHADGGHSAFHATYTFDCDTPDALTTLTFPFFDQFPGAQEIAVEYVTDAGAGRAELTRDAAQLTLE